MYKVYYDNRYILVSSQPDRLQKYSLFHKFHDETDLYRQIENFINDNNIDKLNLYSYKIDHLWSTFRGYFRNMEAAGGLVINSENRLLFIRRNERWDIPKGHIEKGETPEECAIREVTEECGIKPERILHSLRNTYHIYPYHDKYCMKENYWYFMSYHGDLTTTPQLSEGITSAEWIGQERLQEIISDTWLSLRDVIREVRNKFLQ